MLFTIHEISFIYSFRVNKEHIKIIIFLQWSNVIVFQFRILESNKNYRTALTTLRLFSFFPIPHWFFGYLL
jgi:hypothetical protein